MNFDKFNMFMKNRACEFESVMQNKIDAIIAKSHSENAEFYDALKYSLYDGGKRIRPILLMETYKIFGGKNDDIALDFAIALELIHNYSLIHDDLPAIDNDNYRRGKLSNHKVYGENIAILTGDAMLNLAYEQMSESCLNHPCASTIEAMHEIAFNAGISGMIAGQVMEIFAENFQIDNNYIPCQFDELINLNYILDSLIESDKEIRTQIKIKILKTSCLFSSAIIAGAILTSLDRNSIESMRRYSVYLGLAFQLKDDLMDKEFIKNDEKLSNNLAELFSELSKKNIEKLSESKPNFDFNFYINLSDYMINRHT